MRIYDELKNLKLLEELQPPFRVIFALLCAFRLLPAYRRFHSETGRGDSNALSFWTEKLWSDSVHQTMDEEELKEGLARCLNLIPSEEFWHEETQPYAEDAATAVAYAYRARLSENPQEAAWSARRVYESLDRYLQNVENPEDETAIQSGPLIQAELRRQERDLAELAGLSSGAEESLRRLRERSEAEAYFILPSISD